MSHTDDFDPMNTPRPEPTRNPRPASAPAGALAQEEEVELPDLSNYSAITSARPADRPTRSCRGGDAAFWAMHDTLYEHQRALTDADVIDYVEDLGLAIDASRLAREVADGVYAAQIKEQVAGGVRSGVQRTPTFFINDARLDGDWTDDAAFAAALNAPAGRNIVQDPAPVSSAC